jgi:5-methyltetrahydrofolate--homocysteine methyltransferase
MSNLLAELLAERDWLLADGATGTNLFNMGLAAGEAPEIWNEEEPEKVRALYDGAIGAGSDIFLTNSFGGNASRLKLHKREHDVHRLNRLAAEIGRAAADASGRKVVVAGSVGPTGELPEPLGTLAHTDAVAMFEEQARGLLDGGADVLWVETISAPEEFRAAAEAFGNLDAPWCGTMSFDTAGRTMMGLNARSMVEMIETLPHKPLAFGANCGVGASDLIRTVLGMSQTETEIPLIAKGNAGIPKYVDGHIHYDGTPELMADYAMLALNSGATIIGGCCGTMPQHLEKMREALETRPKGGKPTLDEVATKLGGFSSADDGLGASPDEGNSGGPRERRRRRR